MSTSHFTRRSFLQKSLAFAAGAPLACALSPAKILAAENASQASTPRRSDAKVAIAQCRSYGPEVRPSSGLLNIVHLKNPRGKS